MSWTLMGIRKPDMVTSQTGHGFAPCKKQSTVTKGTQGWFIYQNLQMASDVFAKEKKSDKTNQRTLGKKQELSSFFCNLC